MPLPALIDDEYLALSRAHITNLLRRLPLEDGSVKILEIGPKLGWPGFHTLDIDPSVKPTFCADVCGELPIEDNTYDLVLCLSVLEHVYHPDSAIHNIRRILKPSGMAAFQAPLNFRQHGPQPDLWRFTHNGWRFLLQEWDDVQIDTLDAPERPLFPIAYAITAKPAKTMKDGVSIFFDSNDLFEPEWVTR